MALFEGQAIAQVSYDWRKGNSYTLIGNSTFGQNANIGSTWQSHTFGNQAFGAVHGSLRTGS